MSRLSNVREILQFHYCNVTLYIEKETVPQGQNRGICFVTTAHFYYIYKLFFDSNLIKIGGELKRLWPIDYFKIDDVMGILNI